MRRFALLLVTFVTLAGCSSGADSPTTTAIETTTTTTTTTTIAPTTPTAPTTTTTSQPPTADTKKSATFPGTGDTAYLTSVDVTEQAVITFTFEGEAIPAYRVAFVDPPIVADGSGLELDLGGDAFLQVVVTPGAGVDLSGDEPRETFAGPDRFTVDSTDHIVELAETGDFESVLTWTIGLDATRPFTVEAAPGSLVVEVIASQDASARFLGADVATCSSPDGFAVSYPSDWWASSGEPACGFFAPTELDLAPATDVSAPVMILVDPVDFQTAATPSESSEELSRAVTTLDGHRAARTVSTVQEGLYPAGTEVTTYLVELTSGNDALILEVCLTVDPGDTRTCLTAPTGNRIVATLMDDVLVGLAGPDVFRVEVEDGIAFLPVPIGSAASAWAVPFESSGFNVLGTDGDTILIEAIS